MNDIVKAPIALIMLLLLVGVTFAADICVDKSGNCTCMLISNVNTTIQAAINNATDGDTIYVCSGDYTESVNVNKTLSIIGVNGSSQTFVNGDSQYPVFNISADYVNITGFTIRNGAIGVYIGNVQDCNISSNKIVNNTIGIQILGSNNIIYNNFFANPNNANASSVNMWNVTLNCLSGLNIIGGTCIGGNFWSDYQGDDYNGDGISDHPIPYNSSGNIQNGGDFLPLLAIYFVSPTPQSWNATNSNVTINVTHTISNYDTVLLNFNGTKYNITSTLNYTIDISQRSDGTYWYYAWMNDTYGMEYSTATRLLIIDRNPPVFDFFETPQPLSSVYGNVEIKVVFHEEDGSGIANVTFYYNNSSGNVLIGVSTSPIPGTGTQHNGIWYSGIWNITWSTSGLTDGLYTLIARAYDNAGNFVDSQIDVILDNDRLVPSATSDSIATYANQSVTFMANYTHFGSPIDTTQGGICNITIDFKLYGMTSIYTATLQMTYNSTSRIYEYTNNTGFPDWGVIEYSITCNNTAGYENETKNAQTWILYYRSRSGHVYNLETGLPIPNAIVEVEEEIPPTEGGPPTIGWTYTTTANDTGYYEIIFNDTSDPLGSVYYMRARDQTGTLTTPVLPPMPGPFPFEPNETGINMFLVEAANLTLHAHNASGATTFNAEIFDRSAKIPVKFLSNIGPQNYSILLPAGRDYDIVIYKMGINGSPPTTYSWDNASGSKYVDANLTVNMVTVTGYMLGVTNAEYYNITAYIGIGSFFPRDFNAAFNPQINQDNYTLYLPGTSNGIKYVLIAYAKSNSGYYSGSVEITAYSTNIQQNITLYPLYGTYRTGGDVNTNKTRFVFVDNNGYNITGVFMEANITEPTGSRSYIFSSQSQNYIDIPIIQGSSVVLNIFTPQSPPRKKTISSNLLSSNDTITIILPKMEFKDPETDTPLQNVSLKFIKSNTNCNTPYPSSDCIIYEVDDASNFNPLKALMAGNLNIRTEQESGMVVEFINVDLINSGPPDAQFSPNATENITTQDKFAEVWKVGSFAPEIYDYALIGIPYDENKLSENASVKIKFKYLYDDEFNVIWNASVNSTSDVIALGYGDFNPDYFGDGVTCSDTYTTLNPSGECYRNTTDNMIWFTIPHFSGGAPQIEGYIPGQEPTPTPTPSEEAYSPTPEITSITASYPTSVSENTTFNISVEFEATFYSSLGATIDVTTPEGWNSTSFEVGTVNYGGKGNVSVTVPKETTGNYTITICVTSPFDSKCEDFSIYIEGVVLEETPTETVTPTTPTPEETPTTTPTQIPTMEAITPTKTVEKMPTKQPTPTETPKEKLTPQIQPGFEVIFAITGLIAVALSLIHI